MMALGDENMLEYRPSSGCWRKKVKYFRNTDEKITTSETSEKAQWKLMRKTNLRHSDDRAKVGEGLPSPQAYLVTSYRWSVSCGADQGWGVYG